MLYIIRHGITDWNEKHKLQGSTDIPLNDKGRKMASEAREKYKDINFDICYCSPLIRAVETAEILLEGRNIPIVYDDRLREMGFGIYEGIENSFNIPDCPVNKCFFNPEEYTPVDGGESFEGLFERTGNFIEEVVEPELKNGKDIIIVGHGAMNSSIRCRINNISLEHFWDGFIKNCELIRLI